MRLLTTPLLRLIAELYATPLSSKRWEPAHWQKQDPKKRELGFLSEESWKIVGVMRDMLALRDEIGALPNVTLETHQIARGVADIYNEEVDKMLQVQVGFDLIGGYLSDKKMPEFCIRKGGQVVECTCGPLLAALRSGVQLQFL